MACSGLPERWVGDEPSPLSKRREQPVERSAEDGKIQKLEQVIRKGDAFAQQLERQGVDISKVRPKLDAAKDHFNTGEHQKTFALIQEFIGE